MNFLAIKNIMQGLSIVGAALIITLSYTMSNSIPTIEGDWYTEELNKSTIQITKCTNELWQGKIVDSENKEFINMLSNTLNLEAGDVIKMQADTADTITGFVSYALVNREDQNG